MHQQIKNIQTKGTLSGKDKKESHSRSSVGPPPEGSVCVTQFI